MADPRDYDRAIWVITLSEMRTTDERTEACSNGVRLPAGRGLLSTVELTFSTV